MELTGFSAKLLTFLTGLSGLTAYGVILGILLACGLGVPIPEDITLLGAGILAALGNISLTGAIIAGLVGVLAGDAFLFFLGRKLGRRVFKLPLFRTIFTERRVRAAEERVLHNSKFICFTARFLPGLRSPIFLTSGILGVSPWVFLALDGFAALISVPVWVLVGWWVGHKLDDALARAHEIQFYAIIGVILFITSYALWKWQTRKRKKKLPAAPPIEP